MRRGDGQRLGAMPEGVRSPMNIQRLLATVIAEGWPLGRTGLTQIDFDIARAILSDPRVKVTAAESEENRNA